MAVLRTTSTIVEQPPTSPLQIRALRQDVERRGQTIVSAQ
jgi:hypothetical protein